MLARLDAHRRGGAPENLRVCVCVASAPTARHHSDAYSITCDRYGGSQPPTFALPIPETREEQTPMRVTVKSTNLRDAERSLLEKTHVFMFRLSNVARVQRSLRGKRGARTNASAEFRAMHRA